MRATNTTAIPAHQVRPSSINQADVLRKLVLVLDYINLRFVDALVLVFTVYVAVAILNYCPASIATRLLTINCGREINRIRHNAIDLSRRPFSMLSSLGNSGLLIFVMKRSALMRMAICILFMLKLAIFGAR